MPPLSPLPQLILKFALHRLDKTKPMTFIPVFSTLLPLRIQPMVSGYHSIPGCLTPPKSWWMENHICRVVLQVKYFYNFQPNGKEIKQHSCKGKLNKTIQLQKLFAGIKIFHCPLSFPHLALFWNKRL